MKKLLPYFLVFGAGVLLALLFWTKMDSGKPEPFLQTDPSPISYVSSSVVETSALRKKASQDIANSRRNAITRAVEIVSPAVVGINVIQIKQYSSPRWLFDDPFFRHFFPESRDQIVKGLGSGFLISPDGYIVTNEHVVNRAEKIVITLPNGQKYDAEPAGTDYISDIALLKITADKPLPYVRFGDSDDLIIGEWAIAIGNPFGLFDMGQPSVSQGIISATDRDFGRQDDNRVYKDMIQTDAAINSGNSGGPLVNSLGEVIGINTFIFSGSNRSGTSIGLGFATPINRAKEIISELRRYGEVNRRFRTGLEVENLTPNIMRYLRLQNIRGVIVSNVEKNSPAEKAGLRIGDVIVKINDFEIKHTRDIENVIEDTDAKGGDVFKLTILRNRKYYNKSLKLEELK